MNPCRGAIAKSHGICNGKYAEEVSPKLKLQGCFYREKNFLRKLLIVNWEALRIYGVKFALAFSSLAKAYFQASDSSNRKPWQTESINANVCTCTCMQRHGTSLTGPIWHIWSSQRLYEAHPNHCSPPAPILSYD